MAALSRQNRVVAALLIAAAAGVFLLPWYRLESSVWSLGWLAAYPDAANAPAFVLAVAHGRLFLWPVIAALFLPLAVLLHPGLEHRMAALLLSIGGAVGLGYMLLQGFLIGLNGWTIPALGVHLGAVAPQEGMGLGALIAGTAFLLLLAAGLARKGAMRGDIFLVGSILLVVATIALFVFFPVARVLLEAAI